MKNIICRYQVIEEKNEETKVNMQGFQWQAQSREINVKNCFDTMCISKK